MDHDTNSPRHSLDINEKIDESGESHGNFESISTPSSSVPMDRRSLTRHASNISRTEARSRYEVETADNRLPHHHSNSSSSSVNASGKQVISWEVDDPENPYNWPFVSRGCYLCEY